MSASTSLLESTVLGEVWTPTGAAPQTILRSDTPHLDARHAIEADVIRDILDGSSVGQEKLDPKGVQICGARIEGPLDLDGIDTKVGLKLTKCLLDGPLTFRDADLRWLDLYMCILPGLIGNRAQIGSLSIQECIINANCASGCIRLDGTHVATDCRLSNTTIGNRAGPCVAADGLSVAGSAYLDGNFRAVGADLDGGVVRLDGATIGGTLSLHHATLENRRGTALVLDTSTVQGNLLMDGGFRATAGGPFAAVSATEAKISGSVLGGKSTLISAEGPALVVDGFTVQGDVMFSGGPGSRDAMVATGAGERGALRMRSVTISGWLSLEGADVKHRSSRSQRATSHEVKDAGETRPTIGPCAAVYLSGSTIGGGFVLRGANLHSECGPAVLAEYLTVKNDLFLCEDEGQGFTAKGCGGLGAICLPGAAITGQVAMRYSTIVNESGPAVTLNSSTIQSGLLLDRIPTLEGSGSKGTVRLVNAKVSGPVYLQGSVITNKTGPALMADGLTAQGDVRLSSKEDPFKATGAGELGAVRFRGAAISGRLYLDGACVTNLELPSDGAEESNTIGRHAAVNLSGATVGASLILRGACLHSECGPALMADYLTAKGDVAVCDKRDLGFTASGTGEVGAVCLIGATIAGQVMLCGTTLRNGDGPALVADSATIAGNLTMDDGFTVVAQNSEVAAVSLVDATIGKCLTCSGVSTEWNEAGPVLTLARAKVGTLALGTTMAVDKPAPVKPKPLTFDGLTYNGLPLLSHAGVEKEDPGRNPDQDWTDCFQNLAEYAPQPYQALATVYKTNGTDDAARRVLIAQRDDARERGNMGGLSKFGQLLLKRLISYGYRSVKALVWLLGLFAVTLLISTFWFGPQKFIVSVPPATSTNSAPSPVECSFTGQVGYAITTAFPIISLTDSSGGGCGLPPTGADFGVAAFGWIVGTLSATFFVIYGAGLAGITRTS